MRRRLLPCLLLVLLSAGPPAALPQQDDWLKQARGYLQQGNWQAARDLAREALEGDPDNAHAEMLLGLVAMAQSQFPEAEKRFRKVTQIQPQNAQAHAYLGSACLQQHHLADAEKSFRQVLKLSEGNPTAHYNLGMIALERGKPAEALPHLQHVSRLAPDQIPVQVALLETQLRLDDKVSARESAARLQNLIDVKDPLLVQVAGLLATHGEYDEAIEIFEKVRAVAPERHELQFNLGLAYLRAGRFDEAAAMAMSLLEASKGDELAEAYSLLGTIEAQRNRPSEALSAFQKASELEPANEEFRFDYANFLLQLDRTQAAVEEYTAAARDFPQSWRILTGLGGALYVSGQFDEAARALLDAIELQPGAAVTLDLLGKSYEAAEPSRDRIQAVFENHLENQSQDALASYHYGNILYLEARTRDDRDFEKAAAFLKRAIELEPDFALAHLGLGILYQEQGRFEESVTELERATKLSPDLAAAHYRLGQVYQQLGETEKAKAEFAVFQELKGGGGAARETAEALRNSRTEDK